MGMSIHKGCPLFPSSPLPFSGGVFEDNFISLYIAVARIGDLKRPQSAVPGRKLTAKKYCEFSAANRP